jgi:hypothetical protein
VFVRAISIKSVGSPDLLQVEELPTPIPSHNPGEQILIQVEIKMKKII